MNKPTLDANDPRLTQFALGELSANEASEISAAIEKSPELQAAVDEIRQVASLLESTFGNEPTLSLRAEQKAALQTDVSPPNPVATMPPSTEPSSHATQRRRWLPLAIAAGLMGLVIGAVYLNYTGPSLETANKIEALDGLSNEEIESRTLEPQARRETDGTGDKVGGDPRDSRVAESSSARRGVVEETAMDDALPADENDLSLQPLTLSREVPAFESNQEATRIRQAKPEPGLVAESAIAQADTMGEENKDQNISRPPQESPSQTRVLPTLMPPELPPIPDQFDRGGGLGGDGLGGGGLGGGGLGGGGFGLGDDGRRGEAAAQMMTMMQQSAGAGMGGPGPGGLGGPSQGGMGGPGQGGLGGPGGAGQSKGERLDGRFFKSVTGGGRGGSPASNLSRGGFLGPGLPTDGQGQSDRGSAGGKADETAGSNLTESEGRPAETLSDGEVPKPRATNDSEQSDGKPAAQPVKGKEESKQAPLKKTWKRVRATPNTTRLMIGDQDELALTGMQVNVQVEGFRARVLVDCFYYNDRAQRLEGDFKLRLPDDASPYYFAFGESAYALQEGKLAQQEFLSVDSPDAATDGTEFISFTPDKIRRSRRDVWSNVKEARMVPREKAAHAFRETVRRRVDPALVEWSGAGVFNARVFPLAPHKLHRIVVGYDVNLNQVGDDWVYQLALPAEPGQCQVDINVRPFVGEDFAGEDFDDDQFSITPATDAREFKSAGGRLRRYRFNGNSNAPIESPIELRISQTPNVLLETDGEQLQAAHDTAKELARKLQAQPNGTGNPATTTAIGGKFWGLQVKPDLPTTAVASNSHAIFLLDTSLSSNPDKFNVWIKMLRATLDENRDSLKQFNVMFFDVSARFWRPAYIENTPTNVSELLAACDNIALEGATDLYAAIDRIASSPWVAAGDIRPDLFLLSDGAATWGETNLRLIESRLQAASVGSLFAYQTGLNGTAIANLRMLAGQSGGAVFSISSEDEIKTAATAHRSRPWKLDLIAATGATDIMTAGRTEWVYPGQTLMVVGRGEVEERVEIRLSQGSETRALSIAPKRVRSELASRLYGQVAVGQLESLGNGVFDVAAAYARHFRVTGGTCSLLMLDSEADYQRFGIKAEDDLFVIQSKAAGQLVDAVLARSANELADPRAQMKAWLSRLETMPGMEFKMPTALQLVLDDLQIVAVNQPLECNATTRDELSQPYLKALAASELSYDTIAAEAERRNGTSVDDAIKVISSLVERNPGDIVIARDVAFTAMEWDRPAQAYHLLRKVADARPFEGSIYPALGQCLTQLGESDMAILFYEIGMAGQFSRQGSDFRKIVAAEYSYLLRQIVAGKLESSVKPFAAARLASLNKELVVDSAKLLITMMWNTDQSDVDLHVLEPSGEECSYENKRTRSGGRITDDITTGFGPEMYFNQRARDGKYELKVKLFGSDGNRTKLRNKIHLLIYRDFGTPDERLTRRTIELSKVGEKESVATVGVGK